MKEQHEQPANLIGAEVLRSRAIALIDTKIFAGEAIAERDPETGIDNFEYIDNELRVRQADGALQVTYSLVEGNFVTDYRVEFPDAGVIDAGVTMAQYMGGSKHPEEYELSGQDALEAVGMIAEEIQERYGD